MRFHPLEDSFLIDPAEWFGEAVIRAPEGLLRDAAQSTCAGGTCVTPAAAWPDLQDLPQWCALDRPADQNRLLLRYCSAVVLHSSA